MVSAMLPFAVGALLPQQQRATSPSFRRARDPRSLGLHDAAELVAFIRIAEFVHCARVWGWGQSRRQYVKALMAHPPIRSLADSYERANIQAMTEADGWAFLNTMIESGRLHGRPPFFVMQALRAARKRGERVKDLAERIGVAPIVLTNWFHPPRRRGEKGRVRGSVALAL
jgi:hypothetical protein